MLAIARSGPPRRPTAVRFRRSDSRSRASDGRRLLALRDAGYDDAQCGSCCTSPELVYELTQGRRTEIVSRGFDALG